MARQWYHIYQRFTTADGHVGVLETDVNSRKAVKVQIDANCDWCEAKGHTPGDAIVTPTSNPNS